MARLKAAALANWRNYLWLIYLGLGLALLVGYFALPDAEMRSWAYEIFAPLAAVGIVAAVIIQRPNNPKPWLGLAGGIFLLGVGDLVFTLIAMDGSDVPFPSIADLPYLSGYLLIAVSLMAAYRLRRGKGDRSNALDASIIALALAFISADPLIDAFVADGLGEPLSTLTAIAYPAMDVIFMWIAVRLILSSLRPSLSLNMVAFSLIAFLLADIEFAYAADSYLPGDLVDIGWLLGYIFWAVAAAHPSMRWLTSFIDEPAAPTIGRVRLTILGLAATSPLLGFIIASNADHDGFHALSAVVGSAVMVSLVLFRMVRIVLDLRRTLEERDELQGEVTWHQQYDTLTSLANRALFQDRLAAAWNEGSRNMTVLVLDLDGFGRINDTAGTEAGDQILIEVGNRLRTCFRSTDVVARLGGDEFAVLSDRTDTRRTAMRVLDAIAQPFLINGHPQQLRGSLGVAVADRSLGYRDLLNDAVVASHLATNRGNGGYELFHIGMQEELIAANGLRADLERAVEQREFEVYYQPVLRVDNGQLEGAEALVRWRHPQRGLVAPAEFISFAEQSGLIVPIGRFVLRTACQQAADWIRQHPEQDDFTMNVNLSPAQMRSSDVVDDVASALQAANLDPRHLVLEITEGMLIEVDRFEGMLNELRAMGVRLALDDFGTGYSSLSYLGRLPFTTLKIDRSFFLALAANRPEGALIAVIQQIASSLNMTTVAEGIEGVEQLDYLRKLGVDLVQSFSTGRPVSATDFAAAFA